MVPEEYAELLNYIQKNNGWKDSYGRKNLGKVPFIKYITSHYDTRDGTYYKIIIRDEKRGYKIFNINNETDYGNLMNYLKGDESVYTLSEN